MTIRNTEILNHTNLGVITGAQYLHDGKLVAFPTETVFGLGADATNDAAVADIYEAKGRPTFNPLIIHVSDLETAQKFAIFNPVALKLAKIFWPGPLSMVLPIAPKSGLSKLVTAGLDTVAIRVPADPTAQTLLAMFGGAVAAPSANLSGHISPTTVDHVLAGLNGRIDAIIDADPCDVGLESTIVLPSEEHGVALLRAGGIASEDIGQMMRAKLVENKNSDLPQSPGQLTSHYAPNLPLRNNVVKPFMAEAYLGFGDVDGDLNLSPRGDLHEAAANLFAYLHKIEEFAKETGKLAIAVAPVPDNGLGHAINDRLSRAAAPR